MVVSGATVFLLTPPIFDAAVIPEKVAEEKAEKFGYSTPYEGYNDVLAEYAAWLSSLEIKDVFVIDLNGPMLEYTKKQRETDPDFAFSGDGVHPGLAGHVLMAQQILKGIGVPIDEVDPQLYAQNLEKEKLYDLVQKRRAMRSMAWLVDIGFEKPGEYNGLPVQEAEEKAQAEKDEILKFVNR